jgi:hypothetical protein
MRQEAAAAQQHVVAHDAHTEQNVIAGGGCKRAARTGHEIASTGDDKTSAAMHTPLPRWVKSRALASRAMSTSAGCGHWTARASVGQAVQTCLARGVRRGHEGHRVLRGHKSSTAWRCASRPSPDRPWRAVDTRRYDTNLPSAIMRWITSGFQTTQFSQFPPSNAGLSCCRRDQWPWQEKNWPHPARPRVGIVYWFPPSWPAGDDRLRALSWRPKTASHGLPEGSILVELSDTLRLNTPRLVGETS